MQINQTNIQLNWLVNDFNLNLENLYCEKH